MKLAFVELNGFRGYRKPMRIDFADRFTIIDGRNGVGKSTIFNAIEFALTGMLGRYHDAKAGGETVADYLWWTGEGPAPTDRYVEVGFFDGDTEIRIRRGEFDDPEASTLEALAERLCDRRLAPVAPLNHLCSTAIIRDEHITSLSLDLKDTDRYALLRDALGANDADAWISRGAQIVSVAKRRTAAAQQEVTSANTDVAAAARRLDEVRASLVADTVMAEVVKRLQAFANTVVAPDQLAGPVRERIAVVGAEIESLRSISDRWSAAEAERSRVAALSNSIEAANAEKDAAAAAVQALTSTPETISPSSLASEARDLIALVALGRQLGLRDGHCPLCEKGQSHQEFEHGIQTAEAVARRLNESAARAAEREQTRGAAEKRLAAATRAAEAAESAQLNALKIVNSFDQQRQAQGIAPDAKVEQITARAEQLRQTLDAAQKDLRVLETLRFSVDLERAQRAEADAKTRLSRAQERFGRARKAEAGAQALHDAARRAASETLDRRLERVLPLMSELYRRLRPHPVWNDIEYSIRGDVRRFLTLQVGEELNPQFLFSSGQRRATGLAFLLSVNLSLAWSRWRTILLDDPVQHVDDFRTVHLAELAAQLVSEGRQIICAVEDAALADLLCRRLPVDRPGAAKRITLGPDADGALTKLTERLLTPLMRNSLSADPNSLLQAR
jgi:energy-coupling factor transporter ATP-binding protein EcfA2